MMLKKQDYYQELAYKWQNGTITPEEELEFTAWFNRAEDTSFEIFTRFDEDEEGHRDRLFLKINEKIEKGRDVKKRHFFKTGIAASLVFALFSIGLYSWYAIPSNVLDFPPAGNVATLKLADGTIISLNDIEEGNVVEQGGVTIMKEEDGLLTYTIDPLTVPSDEFRFNTISTPKGGQYKIVLFDGTKVWLNAASSLTYPTVFSGDERKVVLKGEGYFEVAKNEDVPFKVQTDRQEIVVLGTHFNVNSYEDEGVTKTTLLEGSVRVTSVSFDTEKEAIAGFQGASVLLKPGQQANLLGNNEINISTVDANKGIAWKKGIFSFNDSNIEAVILEFSRWYNVDIEFKGRYPDIKLWGEIDRNVNIEEAMEILKYFDLKFKVVQHVGQKKIIISSE